MAKDILYNEPSFRLTGDRGLLMEFGNCIDPRINARIRSAVSALEADLPPGVDEIIPAYCSLVIAYDPVITSPDLLIPGLLSLCKSIDNLPFSEPDIVELPVCYHESLGPDLYHVAELNSLEPEAVVEIHTAAIYPVYMIGFTPGFPYLGGLCEKIHTPRLSSPRTRVPAGSVGIANNQTGIYPVESPGGWQIIGRCPVRLFDPLKDDPTLLKAGDLLKFKAITLDEFYNGGVS